MAGNANIDTKYVFGAELPIFTCDETFDKDLLLFGGEDFFSFSETYLKEQVEAKKEQFQEIAQRKFKLY